MTITTSDALPLCYSPETAHNTEQHPFYNDVTRAYTIVYVHTQMRIKPAAPISRSAY